MRSSRILVLFTVLVLYCIALSGAPGAGELQGGVAAVDITPPVGALHCAIGIGCHRGWVNRGIHDPISARILVLSDGSETVTIVSLDLLGFVPTQIRQLLPPEIKNTVFCATHNHLGPATVSFTPPLFSYRTPYLSEIEKNIADAIVAVHASLVPVTIGNGKGAVDLSYNKLGGGKGLYLCGRDNPERIPFEPVDPEVGVIRIDTLENESLAVLVNYAAHPVVVWTSDYVSAEYPGYMRSAVENEIDGDVICFFMQGACGDTQPYESCSQSWLNAKSVGEKLAYEVLEVYNTITPVSYPEAKIECVTDIISLDGIREAAGMALPAELTTVVLNDTIALVSGPGEFYVDFQIDLKKRSPIGNTFFFGYTNGYLGYFPTRKAWEEDWNKWYNHNLWVEIGAGEKLIEKALENIRGITGK